MRNVLLYMSMSLDGYVASGREHPGIAIAEDEELRRWKLERVSAAGAHLMGRKTYEEMSTFWPHSSDAYAAPMNEIPKVVFSTTLADGDATWPTTRVARGDVAAEIAAIKQEPGRDVIAWGGASFAGALAARDLVDEYRLLVQPLALGQGQTLFGQLTASRHLDLVEARPFSCGAVLHVYRPQRGRVGPEA